MTGHRRPISPPPVSAVYVDQFVESLPNTGYIRQDFIRNWGTLHKYTHCTQIKEKENFTAYYLLIMLPMMFTLVLFFTVSKAFTCWGWFQKLMPCYGHFSLLSRYNFSCFHLVICHNLHSVSHKKCFSIVVHSPSFLSSGDTQWAGTPVSIQKQQRGTTMKPSPTSYTYTHSYSLALF